ncbi:MAG: DEAD/DEAH box helicase [Deltaproteobacteria bacterium]|jgi:ATP-dependent RNA helicase RhlE|nr:DEAD/DEAH box helicase [Deltaproteobacteria bacterium]MBT4262759.1 DEAD/DEAH box helicase [Deltaproteobacteria bacterium]MBT4637276.1 DEAD/DEAH box helicase [Deltaproteobacteria bacterium]MBT6502317.1 DEAD/DEAH box helicase [Deltaproteobacteria bacterium]MBT6614153.1 DEAD/DEAH box helicase [Deltaproteobacteria bacterium]
MSFSALNLPDYILRAIETGGYEQPTAIQKESIPLIQAGRDLIAEAQTGTGKTAAFALPILQMLNNAPPEKKRLSVQALVLTPTRELALQVASSFRDYGQYSPRKLSVVSVIGGVAIDQQTKAINRGADIVVATPGRLLDLFYNDEICLTEVKVFVIDEGDKMLNLGFADELDHILEALPKKRQNLLFSATFPEKVTALTEKVLTDPIRVRPGESVPTVVNIHQRVLEVNRDKRGMLLRHLLNTENWEHVLVFVASKRTADNLVRKLTKNGIKAIAFHGNLHQADRIDALERFKAKKVRVLIATDIAARGIDIIKLTHVINFDLPRSPADYIHRIGRTGRAGESGTAISFISHENQDHFALIEKRAQIKLEREQIEGFELTGRPQKLVKGKAPVKGKRKSKKDRAREMDVM